MKRKIMLFKMVQEYERLRYSEELHDDEIMEGLLTLVEKEGMRQPSYVGLMRNGEKFVRELHAGYDVMQVIDRWEPENV